MGVGSSRKIDAPRGSRQSRRRNSPGKKRRRPVSRRIQPPPSIQSTVPTASRHHRSSRHPSAPISSVPFFVRPRPNLPLIYNNYFPWSYHANRLPFGIPPQSQPIYQQMMMPIVQPVPPLIPQMMPSNRFVPASQPVLIPQPMPSSFYPNPVPPRPSQLIEQPISTPYAQAQLPVYNMAPVNVPIQPTMVPRTSENYGTSYRVISQNLFTDWTGGGMISPGFLGPPL